jgi:hypothetical protein
VCYAPEAARPFRGFAATIINLVQAGLCLQPYTLGPLPSLGCFAGFCFALLNASPYAGQESHELADAHSSTLQKGKTGAIDS